MNENAKLWLDTLETTDKLQGKRVLEKVVDGQHYYCCLGIACRLAVEAGILAEPIFQLAPEGERASYECEDPLDRREGVLPKKVIKWLGLRNASGTRLDGSWSCTQLNDTFDFSFKAIAKHLRENEADFFVSTQTA